MYVSAYASLSCDLQSRRRHGRNQKNHENLFFSDVQVRGKYPAYSKRFFKENNIELEIVDGDLEILEKYPVDFMSFSYYMSSIARKQKTGDQTAGNLILSEPNPYLEAS
nr:family 1 glycosylhydrolase [Streptococcus macedonicus]